MVTSVIVKTSIKKRIRHKRYVLFITTAVYFRNVLFRAGKCLTKYALVVPEMWAEMRVGLHAKPPFVLSGFNESCRIWKFRYVPASPGSSDMKNCPEALVVLHADILTWRSYYAYF